MKETFESLVEHLLSGGFFMEEAVELMEKSMIERALVRTKSNQSAASKLLGIHRNTLQRKMVQYKLEGARPRRKPPVRESAKARARKKKA
jgi:DNA-binding NtrC family response regulator